jgi:hypothetical protein
VDHAQHLVQQIFWIPESYQWVPNDLTEFTEVTKVHGFMIHSKFLERWKIRRRREKKVRKLQHSIISKL